MQKYEQINNNIHLFFDDYDYKKPFNIINFLKDINDKNLAFIVFTFYPLLMLKSNLDFDKIAESVNYFKNKNLYIIFATENEGISENSFIKVHIKFLQKKFKIPFENFIIASGCLSQQNIKNCRYISSFGKSIANLHTKFDHEPKHHFISLSRIPKPHRIQTTVQMLERGLQNFGYMSMGTANITDDDYEEIDFSLIPEKFHDIFPIILDGKVNLENQFNNSISEISDAFCNVVLETTYDSHHFHNFQNFTEKSMKPFAWGQVPLFLCCHNQLHFLREWGFDLFDDIINHSYDLEINPDKRINMIVSELEKICSHTIDFWINYKLSNIERFKKNLEVAKNFYEKTDEIFIQDLRQALAGGQGLEPR